MKRKILFLLAISAMVFYSPVASAALPTEEFALGNIRPGMTAQEAEKILGAPLSVHDDEQNYANGLKLEIEAGIVKEIKAKHYSQAATPAGVTVGQSADVLNGAYGKADKISNDYGDYETDYIYYSTNGRYKLEIEVKNSVITEIKCKLRH